MGWQINVIILTVMVDMYRNGLERFLKHPTPRQPYQVHRETRYAHLFVGMLESIVDSYKGYIQRGQIPPIADPGVPRNSVTNGMTFSAFEGFYNKVKDQAVLARKALNLQNDSSDNALDTWRRVFGRRFPGPRSTASLLKPVAVPRLTFPDKPIAPRKPGGFA